MSKRRIVLLVGLASIAILLALGIVFAKKTQDSPNSDLATRVLVAGIQMGSEDGKAGNTERFFEVKDSEIGALMTLEADANTISNSQTLTGKSERRVIAGVVARPLDQHEACGAIFQAGYKLGWLQAKEKSHSAK